MLNPPFTIRATVPSDSDRVAEVLLMSRKTLLPFAPLAHTDDEVRAWVGDTLLVAESVTVAVVDTVVEGFIAISQEDHISWINQLYLNPACLRLGMGTTLLTHALATIPKPFRLYTFQQNLTARKFYKRHGFAPIGFSDGASNEEQCPDILFELA
jgi:ribosomal protein S18 acetylase RimI-like enzyme